VRWAPAFIGRWQKDMNCDGEGDRGEESLPGWVVSALFAEAERQFLHLSHLNGSVGEMPSSLLYRFATDNLDSFLASTQHNHQ